MRIALDGKDIYVFRNKILVKRWSYAGSNPWVSLKAFYLSRNVSDGLSIRSREFLNHLTNSTTIPEIKSYPDFVQVPLEDQLGDFLNFLEVHFDVFKDESNRFYYNYKVPLKGFSNFGKFQTKTKFISFKTLIQLYNNPYSYLSCLVEKDVGIKNMLIKRYESLGEINKKYCTIHLQRTKKGFKIDSGRVLTLPR